MNQPKIVTEADGSQWVSLEDYRAIESYKNGMETTVYMMVGALNLDLDLYKNDTPAVILTACLHRIQESKYLLRQAAIGFGVAD
jgi:hypothetical protein